MPFLAELVAPILQAVNSIIQDVHMSPDAKAAVETHMADLSRASEQADQDLDAKLNDIAGQNIRADTSSSDWVVRRARPYFLWIISTALGMNIFMPLFSANHIKPVVIDAGLYSLFGAGFLGYSYLRTKEKLQDKD